MDKNTDNRSLFKEFPAVSTEAWKEKIVKDLKGSDYNKRLVWSTAEGFDMQPFYRNEDLQQIQYLDVLPGYFPFSRGNKSGGNEWLVRQDIKIENIKSANRKILDVLMKGVTSLGLILPEDHEPSTEELENLLENVFADAVELNFIGGDYSMEVIGSVVELVKKYNRDLHKIQGSVDYDPLAYISLHGNFRRTEEQVFRYALKIIETIQYLPHFRGIAVHGTIFKNSGSTIVEELAFSLAMGNEYLSKLTELGANISEVATRIKFNLAAGTNYFMEIAKLRAMRVLWSHIVNAYGPDCADETKAYIHTATGDWGKTFYDPYVNMLRTTTEAMSAILGGTDSLVVQGYDAVFEFPSEFAERIARNQQLLLKEESYFDKVADPAAGSYYIENLTAALIDEAWKLFLNVQEKGGYLEALKKGYIQSMIRESSAMRDMAIATRKISILGTNHYPNSTEKTDINPDMSVFEPKDLTRHDAILETLKPYRGAQEFERIRFKTDQYAGNNKRPVVFMLTMGNLAMRRARAMFAGNFFACAGYEIIDNNGFSSVDQGLEAAFEKQADIIVLCSSDEEYKTIAPEVLEKTGSKAIVVLAGYVKDLVEELKTKGMKHFIHIKSNVLEKLKEFQNLLGIE